MIDINISETYTRFDCLLEGISFVHSASLPEVADEMLTSLASSLRVEGLPPQSGCDLVHLLVFKRLPEIVRDVEHDTLEEEHEGHPLVVGVDLPVLLVSSLRSYSLMRAINAVNAFVLG